MKTLITLVALTLSLQTFASSEKEFSCKAKYLGNRTHVLTGTITSTTTMADVVYIENGAEEFSASMLGRDEDYKPRKYNRHQQMILASGAWIEGSYTEYALLMPENMGQQNRFEAVIRSLNDQGGQYVRLECQLLN